VCNTPVAALDDRDINCGLQTPGDFVAIRVKTWAFPAETDTVCIG